MKTRFLIFLAAMLLGSASAFAQSGNNEPLKGDVNGDGKVDVADITAVIKIMKDGGGTSEETKQYWYVGFGDTPTSVDTSNLKTSETEIGWHKIEGNPTSIHIGGLRNETKVNWMVLIPTSLNITRVSNGDDVTDAYTVSTTIIDGVEYRKWVQIQPTKQFDYDMIQQTQNQQYWYAGQTQPSSMTSNPTVDDTNFTNNKWHTLNGNQISQTIKGGTAGNSWYVAVPTSKSFKPCASDLVTPETSWDKISTITVNSVNYDIWKTYSTGAKLNVYMTVTPVPQQTYYWYLGYDQDLYDNTESSKTKMLTLTSNNVPTQYTRSSGNKYQIPGTTPNYLIMVIPTTWTVPVIGNPAGGTIGLIKEKSSVSITGISGITFDVYSTDIATIKEVYIN